MDPTFQKVLEGIGEHRGEVGVAGEGRGSLGTNHLLVSGETSGISQQPEYRNILETALEEAEVQTKTTKKQSFRVNSKKISLSITITVKTILSSNNFFLIKAIKRFFFSSETVTPSRDVMTFLRRLRENQQNSNQVKIVHKFTLWLFSVKNFDRRLKFTFSVYVLFKIRDKKIIIISCR